MLQEERLHSCQDAARPTLVLFDAILDRAVEEETLHPTVVEVSGTVLEQQVLDAAGLFGCDVLLDRARVDPIAHLRVEHKVLADVFVKVITQDFTPLFLVHVPGG